jgi:hypothetical protein
MRAACVDFGYPIDGNPVSLLDGKRVIGWLEFDAGANPAVAEMHARLEILRARIERQFG